MNITAYHRSMTPAYERVLGDISSGRWTALRKEAVVVLIALGRLKREEAQQRFAITPPELDAWERRLAKHGTAGLRQLRITELRI